MTQAELILYRGFGSGNRVCVAGRLIRPSQLVPARDNASLRRRLRDAWKLLVSRTIPQTDIELKCGNTVWNVTTDSHGYFFSNKTLGESVNEGMWKTYEGRVTGLSEEDAIHATGQILQGSADADQLIISDIDDTVVHTGVANKLIMMWHLYASGTNSRAPFPGMSAFLDGLHHGGSGTAKNPMLYVSRSPWSIYPLLDDVFNRHGIPAGPVLLLRDWGITWRHPWPRRASEHKATMIDHVMQAFPDLPAILIGDSGQRDPENYRATVERYGSERVRAIYIRDLGLDEGRTQQLKEYAEEMAALGVHFMSGSDTTVLADDAAAQGYMSAEEKVNVEQEKVAEEEAAAS